MCNTPLSSKHSHARHTRARRCLLTAASLLLCASTSLLALPQDSEQPVDIKADRTEFDNSKQQHTLSGNVEITQGSMRILAEKITLTLKDGEITRIEGIGTPLRYTITDNDGLPLSASADNISYSPLTASLSLKGNAKLERPDKKLTGNRIDYNISSAQINAVGSTQQRVNIVIQPEKKPQ